MPDLPTITVTQAQADRIIAAFGADQATAVPAYKRWLAGAVRQHVLQQAAEAQQTANVAATTAALVATEALLPPEA